jgi:1-acyl-sn-glycerol-3-phosphate acyltransferase
VDAAVSAVSRVPQVREALMPRQRALAEDGGIVVAGRDIGTVVLPDADLKLFLDASVEERAARRIEERGLDPGGEDAERVREQLRARDAQDAGRTVAPLRAAEDARHVRTDGNTFDQTVAVVVDRIRATQARLASAPAGRAPAAGTRLTRMLDLERAKRFENHKTTLIRLVELVSRIGARLFADVRHQGLERIPRSGGVILALNHVSNADVFMSGPWISQALGRRRIHWLGKKELFGWPVFGWLAARGGIHPVDRSTADVDAFRLASEILERGYVLLVFPEGTRSPTGALQEAKDGTAALALRTGATIVPIGINNTDAVWPKGRKLPMPIPRRRVIVRIGEPFRLAELVPPGTDRRSAKALATRAMMGRIAELLDERHRGAYADAVRPEAPAGPLA